MKYLKPEVRVISTATNAIESSEFKDLSPLADHIDNSLNNTGPAYEADE